MSALLLIGCLYDRKTFLEYRQFFEDDDGDGFAEADEDCDDTDASINPVAPERCDLLDNNCDGQIDENLVITWYLDADQDGVGVVTEAITACEAPAGYVSKAGDCDDSNPARSPELSESCDELDNDCNGLSDDGLLELSCYPDHDQDGFGDANTSPLTGCSCPSGYREDATDCDDLQPTSYPGAPDSWYDGIDSDCGGENDFDADQDGDTILSAGGNDCDDADPNRSGLFEEGWHDLGIDNNCDGSTDDAVTLSLSLADGILDPLGAEGNFGYALGQVGDLDADGLPEVWSSAPYDTSNGAYSGAVYIIPGSTAFSRQTVEVSSTSTRVLGEAGSFSGASASLTDQDGFAVLAVGSPGSRGGDGAIYLFQGEDLINPGSFSSSDASGSILGEAGMFLGAALTAVDVDGNGETDILATTYDQPRILVFLNPALEEQLATEADLSWVPATGTALQATALGDLDEDGYNDIGITEENADIGAGVLRGGVQGSSGNLLTLGMLWFTGATSFGTVAELSISNDPALLVFQWQASLYLHPQAGATYDPLSDADAVLFRTAEEGPTQSGIGVGWFGDAGEGLLVGAVYNSLTGEQGECTFWPVSALSSEQFATDLPLQVMGEDPGDHACHSLLLVGDVDGSGHSDVLIGAPFADAQGQNAGRVYLLTDP